MYRRGEPIEYAQVRACQTVQGDLRLQLRIYDPRPRYQYFIASLLIGDDYVIAPLDQARVTEIRGAWLHIEGLEPKLTGGRNRGELSPQAWWCKIIGAIPAMPAQASSNPSTTDTPISNHAPS